MQCGNCQFENIPGVRACGRCGASLELDSLPIDVHPHRATPGKKRWRRWFPISRYWNRFNSTVDRLSAALRITGWPADLQTPAVLLRMIVPGWAQHYTGRIVRARWMFGGYLGLLLSGLLSMGTALGWLLLGLAISLHAASILDIMAANIVDLRRRFIYSAAAIFLLFFCIYYPARQLLSLVASPQRFGVAMFPFEAGDVLLVNPSVYLWSDPQPGDLVHYRMPSREVRLPGRVYRLQGERINRIIARAGQKVTCNQGELLVDGRPSPWMPLDARQLPAALDVTVPENSYLIISTEQIPQVLMQEASIVPRDQILGRVYWRNQPLRRFGPMR